MAALLAVVSEQQMSLSSMTNEALKAALAESIRVTAKGLRDAAVYVKELESRGEDLDHLKISLMKWLRLIAYGQVLPEVVVRFAGRPGLLAVVASLPIPDQERLAAGGSVKMMTRDDGVTTHRMVDPRDLSHAQIRQVFGNGCIRQESEQVVWLDNKRTELSRPIPKSIGELHLDPERGGVTMGRKFIPLADLVAAVKLLQRKR